MDINEIRIKNEGYIDCKSNFYSVCDILNGREFKFVRGTNILNGDIDSGVFAISYFVSMYPKINRKTLFMPHEAFVNEKLMQVSELSKQACYLDQSYHLFASRKPVSGLIARGLKRSGIAYSVDEIRDMFEIEKNRFDLPINATGNERFKVMAAVGFCYEKHIFCFPWMSRMRYECFEGHTEKGLDVLESMGKIAILPIGNAQ